MTEPTRSNSHAGEEKKIRDGEREQLKSTSADTKDSNMSKQCSDINDEVR